ncbi:MAG: citrate lyase holo-[acyl-carrier protein] synthase, partial [Muribaculaceae bacterium]|nr:citrate lyase holo-[acyl-carrier protein] synthase [Muribaculaceae bacterium]
MVTLEHLLKSRDARSALQRRLLHDNPGKNLICMTVVMPGSEKRNRQSLTVASAAVKALREVFGEISVERDLETGYEAYLLTALPVEKAKAMACRIEDTHPLGRLFDIDVIAADGKPAGRSDFGLMPRKCLICGNDARVCMRLRSHDYNELLQHISKMIEAYGLR